MRIHRNVTLLAWFNFFVGFIFFAPVAILYFAQVAGSYALGMSVFSISEISSAVFELPTGVFSDMVGRKNTVVAGAVVSVISVVCYALSGSYWMLVVGALFEGLGRSFYSGNNNALLHDSLKEAHAEGEYHTYYGKLQSVGQIGLAMVMLAGGILASISFSLVMWVTVIPKLIALCISLFLVEPTVHEEKSTNIYAHLKESFAQFRDNRKLRLLTVIDSLRFSLGEGAYLFRTAFVASLWPLWAVGISNMLSNIGAAAGFFFAGRLIDRFGYKKIMYLEIIGNRIINFTTLLFPTVASPAIMGLTSLGHGSTSTAINTMQQKEFTQKERASLGSLNSLVASLAFGVVAVAIGFVGDQIGPVGTLLIVNVLLIGLIFLYRQLFGGKQEPHS